MIEPAAGEWSTLKPAAAAEEPHWPPFPQLLPAQGATCFTYHVH